MSLSENGFWLAFWRVLAGLACVLVVCITLGVNFHRYLDFRETVRLIEAGYTRTTMPGVAGVYWTKENK